MKVPADGWDREEREALAALRQPLESLQARHEHDPDIELLRAGHHDALPPDLQASVAQRLANDPWARALVEGLAGVEPAFDEADQDRLLARIQREADRDALPATRWAWLRPVLASAILVAVTVAGWIAYRDSSAPSTVAPPPDRTTASAPAAPAFELPLDKPEVTLSLAALTWRGGGADNSYLQDLKRPLDAFRQGDYAGADRGFAALESRYPGAVEVFFYGGVSRLFVNEPARALVSLTKASELADATFAPQVFWYRAIAAHRSGDAAGARRILEELCSGTSDRATSACEAAKRINATPSVPQR